MTTASPEPAALRPALPYMIVEDGGTYLSGSRCRACGEVHVGLRSICPACSARNDMLPIRLAATGRLYCYTIVHRSFPGIEVPFIAATVDLDGGGTIKGNLKGVPPVASALAFDMPVRVVFEDAGRIDREGNRYMSYCFVLADVYPS